MAAEHFKVKINMGADKKEVTPEAIRNFVKGLGECQEKIKDARDALKAEVDGSEIIENIKEQIKGLKEDIVKIIDESPVISKYKEILEDAVEEKHQLINDAKSDGIPRKEIDLAIKALQKDIDMAISIDIYSNIADLVD